MSRLDDIEARVNARMAEINRRLGGEGPVAPAAASSAAAGPAVPVGCAAADVIRSAVGVPAVAADTCPSVTWETSPQEIFQLMQYVCASPHVTSNVKYGELVDKLAFAVEADDPTINAYATIDAGDVPKITLLGGAIRFANLISCAYVGAAAARTKTPGNPLPEITAAFARFLLESRKAEITPEQASAFAKAYSLQLVAVDPALGRKAKSFSAGLMIGILAHEFGHLALGHCYGGRVNLEVSRNQEREADSFASSVISSSPFGDYLVFGTILWEAVWVWVEKATGQAATTHPLSAERLADLVRANPSVAAEFGLA